MASRGSRPGNGGFLYPLSGGYLNPATGGFLPSTPDFLYPADAPTDTTNEIDYDFTTSAGATASGVVVTRSGATIYPQTSASTCTSVGNNLPIWEDRGGAEGGGIWVFDTYTNSHADPFDFLTSWTHDASVTYTANVAVGPDGGATNVDRIRDTSAVADQRVYRAGASALQYISMWVRDVAGDAPTAPGLLASNLTPTSTVSLGTGTTWRRVWVRASGTHFAIYPSTTAGTGAIEVWGSQRVSGTIPRWFNLPLAMGGSASGLCTVAIPAADIADVLGSDGEFDFETGFIAAGNVADMVSAVGTDIHLFHFDTPNGALALRFGNINHWTLMVNGVDRLSTSSSSATPSEINWREGDEVVIRVHVTSTTCRIRVRVNALVANDARVGSLSLTLAAPTAGWLGSQGTTVGTALQSRLTKFQTFTDHTTMLATTGEDATVVTLGDSTMGLFSNEIHIGVAMGTVAEGRAGKRIGSVAQSGSTISVQNTRWAASQYAQNTSVLAAVILVGINDVNGASSVATLTTAYQNLITAIRLNNAAIKIVANLMLPADTYAGMDATDQQNWIDLNSCIAGVAAGGGAAITGIDTVISAPSITANANGSVGAPGVNILRPEYEISVADGVHQNVTLREIQAAANKAALVSLGVW